MREKNLLRLDRVTDLRRALELQEFVLYYQPIYLASDRRLIGFEAFIRWHTQFTACCSRSILSMSPKRRG